MDIPTFAILEILGIVAFAMSGIAVARSSDLDLVGCYSCALLTALGGGTVRDVLIGHRPFYWSNHEWLLIFMFILVLIAYLPGVDKWISPHSRPMQVADAVGVGIFSLSGLTLALSYGYGPISASLLAVVTAIAGGVFRDVVCSEIPYAFTRSELCATCSLAGCGIFFLCRQLDLEILVAYVCAAIVAAAMRLLALWKNLKLPI
jgi:uncharacterized membrane protein YeiH